MMIFNFKKFTMTFQIIIEIHTTLQTKILYFNKLVCINLTYLFLICPIITISIFLY